MSLMFEEAVVSRAPRVFGEVVGGQPLTGPFLGCAIALTIQGGDIVLYRVHHSERVCGSRYGVWRVS